MLPLVIMGAISVIGGLAGLRLPETLHHSLPQTVEEGEEFGKDWSMADCIQCIPKRYLLMVVVYYFTPPGIQYSKLINYEIFILQADNERFI